MELAAKATTAKHVNTSVRSQAQSVCRMKLRRESTQVFPSLDSVNAFIGNPSRLR